MNRETLILAAAGIVAGLLFLTEVVSCQWHADTLTNGCASNQVQCLVKKDSK